MFNNALFNSAPETQAMPQYVQQPSAEGPTPRQLLGFNKLIFGGKVQPASGPPKEFSPTMAPPAWAQQQAREPSLQGIVHSAIASRAAQNTPIQASAQFSNPLFNSAPNPYIAPQAVMQPAGAAPAKGLK